MTDIFLVVEAKPTLPVIDEAIRYIFSGEIVEYRYDVQKKMIIAKSEEDDVNQMD